MIDKNIQLIVGPTALPDRVMKAMNHKAYSHRSEYYYNIQKEVCDGIRRILKTKNDVLSLTCSGTGAIEGVVQNLFEPGDKVVIPITGSFGKMIYDVAKPYGLDVTVVEFDYGETADVEKVMEFVTEDTKGVLMVHNESTTGILNDIKTFGEKLRDTETLLIVDAVSSAGGVNIEMDSWGIDVILTASQKALMSPPGLSFVALSDAAWDRVSSINNQKYYFNFTKDRKYIHENRTVHTPATHTLLAVREAISMINEEGLEQVFERHQEVSLFVREEVKKLGLTLIAKDEKYCSPTLTCIDVPGKSKYYLSELKKRNIEVGGGKNPLSEDTFRVGTMGYFSKNDLVAFIEAMKDIMNK